MTSNIKDHCKGVNSATVYNQNLLKFSYCWFGAYLDAARFRDLNTVTCFHFTWPCAFHQNKFQVSVQFSVYSHVLAYSIYTVLVTYE